MNVADIWERFFWSLIYFLLITFIWLGLVDSAVPYSPTGFVVATAVAATYFGSWFVRERRTQRLLAARLQKES